MPELHREAAVGIVLNVHHLSVVGQDEKLATSEGVQTDELHGLCHTWRPIMIFLFFFKNVCVCHVNSRFWMYMIIFGLSVFSAKFQGAGEICFILEAE